MRVDDCVLGGDNRGFSYDTGTHRYIANVVLQKGRPPRTFTAPAGEFPTTFGFAFDAHDNLIASEPFGAAHLLVQGLSRIPPPR